MITPLLATVLLATAPLDSMLITAAQLQARVGDPRLVLLQVGPRVDYDTAHITGARYVALRDVSARGTALALELPDPAVFDSTLESWGVTDSSRIVLYWTSEWISPTTRIYLTLQWFGLGRRAAILDGGLKAWRAGGGAVTRDPTPATARGTVAPRPRSDVVVDAAFMRQQLDTGAWNIVDARAKEFYSGTRSGTADDMPPRYGHLPGAVSVPFTAVVDSTGHFLAPDRVRELFRAAGVDLARPIAAYCHIGQQATAVWFAARLAGLEARLYDGSFQDWATHGDYPVQRP